MIVAVFKCLGYKRALRPKPLKGFVVWEGWIVAALQAQFTFDRYPSEFADQIYIFPNQYYFLVGFF